MSDKIFIHDLKCQAIIGCLPEERLQEQPLIISVELRCNLSKAALSDALEDTLDYAALSKRLIQKTQASQAKLLEHLASQLLDLCLESPLVQGATIQIKKPLAIPEAQSAAVELSRNR